MHLQKFLITTAHLGWALQVFYVLTIASAVLLAVAAPAFTLLTPLTGSRQWCAHARLSCMHNLGETRPAVGYGAADAPSRGPPYYVVYVALDGVRGVSGAYWTRDRCCMS